MSKVVLSPLLRAMLKDEKARQQLREVIGREDCTGAVEFDGKTYSVECGPEPASATGKAIVYKRLDVPQWAKDAQRKVIEWAKSKREG